LKRREERRKRTDEPGLEREEESNNVFHVLVVLA